MGFLGFFKKKEEIREEISLDGLENWLNLRKKGFSSKEGEISDSIFLFISQLAEELKLEIIDLINFDIDITKFEDRIKFIVKENLKNYVIYLEKLIEKLKGVQRGETIFEEIDVILEEFKKKSDLSYKKVNFLIGKEMRATKESLNKFIKELENILKLNKDFFEESKFINAIDISSFGELGDEKKTLLLKLDKNIKLEKELRESLENKKREIGEIEISKEYILELKRKEGLDLKLKELKNSFNQLRMKIDFKALSNFYHSFEKEMSLVKEFKDNFQESLKTYGFDRLISLLKESKLFNNEISKLIEKISLIEKEIKGIEIKDHGIGFLKKDIERVKLELENIKIGVKVQERKISGLDLELENLVNLFKEKLDKIGVDLKIKE